MGYYRRDYQLSSRVDTMKWMGVLQLILGVLMFITCTVMVGTDLEQWADRKDVDRRNRPKNDERILTPQPLASMDAVFLAMVMIAMAVGAGAAGSILTRYEGLGYNMPARHILLVLSAMNGMVSLGYMVFHGQLMFEFIDAEILEDGANWEQGVIAMMLVMFVLAFFNMVVAFLTAIVTTLWNPPMDAQPPMEKPGPVVVEERPYYSRHAYSDTYRYPSGARTLPALKYY